jgi:ABC-type bacteriocin/lantibiotic exporter with double-glycine peptidase domain
MNIVNYLLYVFFKEEATNTGILVLLSLVITLIQTNGISYITANIIQSVEKNSKKTTMEFFNYFVIVSILFFIIYYIYKCYQNRIITKLIQWVKHEIFKIILKSNNENMQNVNFIEFITPITRISVSFYALFYDIITVIIPTLAFLLIISSYFLYENTLFGISFLIANLVLFYYIYTNWNDLRKAKNEQETIVNNNEKFIIDILNNIDKVIYRGETINEINNFTSLTDNAIHKTVNFLDNITNHTSILTFFVYIIIFTSLFFLIKLQYTKKIKSTVFITFMTILLLYRDRIISTINNLPDWLEFVGRIEYITEDFNKMLGNNVDINELINKNYRSHNLKFNDIIFDNVTFYYESRKTTPVFTNVSFNINTNQKIIGVTGLSGKGKSSFAKLLLRLYEPVSGKIYIDGVDISTVDPDYIRQNITYVNQNSKLFDKKIMDNIMYGCKDAKKCEIFLKEIMKYPKIQGLYKNVDIYNTNAGSLGENLSGGQRQVVNIISGLINTSNMLILDEPTNALDIELKEEIIQLIDDFRKYKKCIIIISHDKDIYHLFDETLTINN